jgi:Tfp pilus assembly protein PilO
MKTKNLAVGILAALLVTALWYTFVLKPIRAQTTKVKADTASERAKLAPLQAQVAQAEKDASHEAAFKAELQSLQAAMPDSPALAAFIRDANGIAAASGVSWQSVTHAPPVQGADGVMTITVGITIKGSYAQVMEYLGRLAQLQRLFVVDSVGFNPAADTASGGANSGGAGSPSSSGGGSTANLSTGPFSGASEVAVTISGRMFENGGSVLGTGGAAVSTGTPTAAGATTVTAPALNNS